MALEIRTPADLEDWKPFGFLISVAFGEMPTEPTDDPVEREGIERGARMRPFDFRIGIVEVDDSGGETLLGGCASYEFDVSLPGGARLRAAGLSAVGADPTKRGRGALRTMMGEHLARARQRGHVVGLLNASESSIYRQFGYGCLSSTAVYEIDSDRAAFRTPFTDTGTTELVPIPAARVGELAEIYQRVGDVVPGTTGRDDDWWQVVVGPNVTWLGGGKQIGVIHRDANGHADGYLLYRVSHKPNWVNDDEVEILELLGTTTEAELALFQYARDLPMTRRVRWTQAPLDPAVRHHLRDPRQLHEVDQHDLLWMRMLDVPAVLTARSYDLDGAVTLEVTDTFLPEAGGTWRLVVRGGAATMMPAEGDSDVSLATEVLSAAVLGGTRLRELHRAGLVAGDDRAIDLLDRLLLTARLPFSLSKF